MEKLISSPQAIHYGKAGAIYDDWGTYYMRINDAVSDMLEEANRDLKQYVIHNLNQNILRSINTDSIKSFALINDFMACSFSYGNTKTKISFENNQEAIGSQRVFLKFERAKKTQTKDMKYMASLQHKKVLTIDGRKYRVVSYAPIGSNSNIMTWQIVLVTDITEMITDMLRESGYTGIGVKTKRMYDLGSTTERSAVEITYKANTDMDFE